MIRTRPVGRLQEYYRRTCFRVYQGLKGEWLRPIHAPRCAGDTLVWPDGKSRPIWIELDRRPAVLHVALRRSVDLWGFCPIYGDGCNSHEGRAEAKGGDPWMVRDLRRSVTSCRPKAKSLDLTTRPPLLLLLFHLFLCVSSSFSASPSASPSLPLSLPPSPSFRHPSYLPPPHLTHQPTIPPPLVGLGLLVERRRILYPGVHSPSQLVILSPSSLGHLRVSSPTSDRLQVTFLSQLFDAPACSPR